MTMGRRERWGTRLGVILAVTGSAVGLGNFLRFPDLVAENQGGAFLIPYFISFLLLGLPLAWAEWTLGRMGGARGFHSAPGVYRSTWRHPAAPYLGVIGLLVPIVIYMYYVVIESWCLGYFWAFATGQMNLGTEAAPYRAFFESFVGAGENGAVLSGSGGWLPLISVVVCVTINFFIISHGISRGIERFCLWAMPMLVLCALIVLVRVLTLGTPDASKPEQNLWNALGFLWNPGSFAVLGSWEVWFKAAAQVFFSLSVGFGVIVCYASYLRRDADVTLSATTSAAGNEFCEVALGGMIAIPAGFIFLGPAITGGGSFDLGFNSLPLVFAHMPWGQFFGAAFFLLLFLAAITSSLSMIQPGIAFLEEGLGLGKRGAIAVLMGLTLAGNLFVLYYSRGTAGMDRLDYWAGTVCILLLALAQTLLFGWGIGVKAGMEEMNRSGLLRISSGWGWVLRWVTPAFLLVLFVGTIWQTGPAQLAALREDVVARNAFLFVVAVAALFTIAIALAVRRWQRQEAR